MRWVIGTAWFIGIGSILQTLADQYAINYSEGERCPDRWICWGKCIPLSGKPEHTFSYLLIRLPFSVWERDWYSQNRYRWYWRAWLRFNGKWRQTLV
jgi:hypothetical protein